MSLRSCCPPRSGCRAWILGLTIAVSASADPVQIRVRSLQEQADAGPSAREHHADSLPGAMDLLRRLRAEGRLEQGAVVTLAAGQYHLAEPLRFDASTAGSREHPVVFRAEKKGTAVLTGGRALRGWEQWQNGIWRTTVPEGLIFQQLYWQGQRQILARTPNRDPERPRTGGMAYVIGTCGEQPKSSFAYDPRAFDPSRWEDPSAGRVAIWPDKNWNCSHCPIESIDLDSHTMTIAPARYNLRRGNRFYIEGLLEELDAPGEWYLDRKHGTVYFNPPDGMPPGDAVTVPIATNLIVIAGNTGKREMVTGLVFEGLRLRQCSQIAIVLAGASHCTIRGCEITATGDAGIVIRDGSSNNRIAGCDIHLTGTEGIRIEGVRDWTHSLEGRISGNIITNNHVHHVGLSGNAGGGIDVRPYCGGNVTHENTISHNLIHDTPRKGIMFGGIRNIVEYNEIHHTNLEQSDTGAIGMCTRDLEEQGSIIRYNYLYDTGGYNMVAPGKWEYPNYCWGIYLDDWTSGVTVFGNIVVRTHRGAVHIHGGQDNRIENNIFVDGQTAQILVSPFAPKTVEDRDWTMRGNRILRNVFYYSDEKAVWLRGSRNWISQGIAECEGNIIWAAGRDVVVQADRHTRMSFEQWREHGFDRTSNIADPRFVDLAGGDFTLADDSPAYALGFKRIPIEKIGLLDTPERFSWPVSDDFPREQPVLSCDLPPEPVRTTRAELPHLPAGRTVVIDGQLDPDEWAGAAALSLARDHTDRPASPIGDAFLFWNDRFLYIALRNRMAPDRPLQGGTTWGRSDAVEIAIRGTGTTADGPILVLRGYTQGTLTADEAGGMPASSCQKAVEQVRYAARIEGPASWFAEFAIPWEVVPRAGDAQAGSQWQFNLTCRHAAANQWIMWRPTGRYSYGVGREGMLVLVR